MQTAKPTTARPPAAAQRPPRACDHCGAVFTPKRRHQVHCSPTCRKAAWAERHPTFDDLAEMPAIDFGKAVVRLLALRGRGVPEGEAVTAVVDEMLGACLRSPTVEELALASEEDLRGALRLLMERRHPGRRGRLRVRFGGAGDAPMTEGVC